MANPYIGEVRIFGGSFAPVGWVLCDGRLLQIAEYDALFSLIGTIYGGDGQTTFAVPDLRGRVPLHQGTGPGQSFAIGQAGGAEAVTVTISTMPSHSHALNVSSGPGSSNQPAATVLAAASELYTTDLSSPAPMSAQITTPAGGGLPHENRMPLLALNFIIAYEGIYPSQG